MKVSTSQFFKQAVDIIGQQHSDVAKQQARLGSGKQLVKPSDDASKAALIQRLKSGLTAQESYGAGLVRLTDRLSLEESAITSTENILLNIKDLALRAASQSMGPESRKIMAVEIGFLRDELMALANTRDFNGNYIFAGSMVSDAPYSQDTDGSIIYQGDDTVIEIMVSDQRKLELNSPGESVFRSLIRNGNDGLYSGDLTPGNEATLLTFPDSHKDFALRLAEFKAHLGKANAQARVEIEVETSGIDFSDTNQININGIDITGAPYTTTNDLITAINAQKDVTGAEAELSSTGTIIIKNIVGKEGNIITISDSDDVGVNPLALTNGSYSASQEDLAAQAQAQLNYDNYYSDLRSSGYSDEIDWDTFQGISNQAYDLSYSNDYLPGAPEAKRIGFFDVIGDLIESLELSDTNRIDRGIDEMDSLIQRTALQIADIGSRMNIADAQINIMDETVIRFKNLISSAEDLDYSTAVTELSSEMLALEAAQSSFARISQLSLFDYIR